jgi:uncharacterized protein YlxP (DUF503 family)
VHIGILTLEFRLEGCRSLKEKRQRLGRLRDRFGRAPNVAVCEDAHQDSHQLARWSFVAVGSRQQVVERTLGGIERDVQECADARIIGVERELI